MDVPRLVAVGLLVSRGRVLVQRRRKGTPLAGRWEFPGGKVEFGEHPWHALRRELAEELDLPVERGSLFGLYSHVSEGKGLRAHYVLVAYRVPVRRGRVEETVDRRWAPIRTLPQWRVVPGSRPIAKDLARTLT